VVHELYLPTVWPCDRISRPGPDHLAFFSLLSPPTPPTPPRRQPLAICLLPNGSVALLRNHGYDVTLLYLRVWPSGKSPGPRGDPRSAARQSPSRPPRSSNQRRPGPSSSTGFLPVTSPRPPPRRTCSSRPASDTNQRDRKRSQPNGLLACGRPMPRTGPRSSARV